MLLKTSILIASKVVPAVAVAPIERPLTVYFTQDSNPRIRSGEVAQYSDLVDCFRRLCREEGISSLWQGSLASCLHPFVQSLYDEMVGWFLSASYEKITGTSIHYCVLEAVHGIARHAFFYPLTCARVRLACDVGPEKTFQGLYDFFYKTMNIRGGIMSLYAGFGLSILVQGIDLGSRTVLARFFIRQSPWQSGSSISSLASNYAAYQLAVSCGIIIRFPFSLAISRMQMQVFLQEPPLYNDCMDCGHQLICKRGVLGIFDGVYLEVLLSALCTATWFWCRPLNGIQADRLV